MSEINYFPATTSQELLIYADSFTFRHAWINIGAKLDINQEIDEELMFKAVKLTIERNSYMSIRFHKEKKGKVSLYFSDKEPEGLEIIDYSSLSDDEIKAILTKWTKTPFKKRGEDQQLYQIKLIRRNNNLHCLYICFHHMGFDSYPIGNIIKYISDTYSALKNGTELPPVAPSPMPMYEAEQKYKGSVLEASDIKFWNDFFDPNDEPCFTNLIGKDSKFHKKNMRSGVCMIPFKSKASHLNLRIPKEIVDKINNKALENRISAQPIYYLAFHMYRALINETNDVMGTIALARRSTLAQKRGAGTMVNSVYIRCKFNPETFSVLDAIKDTNANLNQSFKHPNICTGDVIKIGQKVYNLSLLNFYDAVSFCYQPYFELGNADLDLKFERLENGANPTNLEMTIWKCDNSGDLWVNYDYKLAYYKAEHIEKYHAFMLKFLDKAMDNLDKPVGEIAKECL